MTHIMLAGFMGTGKSTVGRILADHLSLPFADLDTEIEHTAGKTIKQIFADEGEKGFRKRESNALLKLLYLGDSIVALGGGALLDPLNMARAHRAGPLVCLTANARVICQRVQAQSGVRPLLEVEDPEEEVRALLEKRGSCYAQADVQIDTTCLTPHAVVTEIIDWMARVRVNLGNRSYDIKIASGCYAELGGILCAQEKPITSAVIISGREIDRRYGDSVRTVLDAVNIPHNTLCFPAGERYKSISTASRLFGDLIQRKVDRQAVIIALGGGVVGDLAGFVAATYQRGVRFVQLPTSLLAQVDSAIGGKVGVNHPMGKNMVGAFLQPLAVLADPTVLRSLPEREIRTGMAEVVKYGVIWDEDFFSYLEENIDLIMRLDTAAVQHVVRRSCQIKAHVVAADETEGGLRAILNFGHTVAHAVETQTSYDRYTHGEAVAIGMVVAARLAHELGMFTAGEVHRLIRLLERINLPTNLPKSDPAVLMSLMESDKKAVKGVPRFILPVGLGKVEIIDSVSPTKLRNALQKSVEV